MYSPVKRGSGSHRKRGSTVCDETPVRFDPSLSDATSVLFVAVVIAYEQGTSRTPRKIGTEAQTCNNRMNMNFWLRAKSSYSIKRMRPGPIRLITQLNRYSVRKSRNCFEVPVSPRKYIYVSDYTSHKCLYDRTKITPYITYKHLDKWSWALTTG